MKAINDKKITELTSNLNKVNVDEPQENIDSQSINNTQSFSDGNSLLLLIVGFILGLIVSFVYARILRRRNIISRLY
mgnify:FL=1